jgi:predicted permease
VLSFAAAAVFAAAATVVFAIIPAWRAGRQSVSTGLRQTSRGSTASGRQYGRAILATAQIALTLALLAAAGLSLSALHRVTDGPLGFDHQGVLVGRLTLPEERYGDSVTRRQFVERVLSRLSALPSVTMAGLTSHPPYGNSNRSESFWPEQTPPRPADATQVQWRAVTPTALSVLRVPLIAGRSFTEQDREDVPAVALVSESLARRFWPHGSLGRRFRLDANGPLITVVGVVGDVTHYWLFGDRLTVYRPYAQDAPVGFALVLRTPVQPAELGADLRRAVQAEDEMLPVQEVRPLTDMVQDSTFGLRFAGRTLGAIALVSCLLSTIGLYSLMSFLTGRRTREIGVRVALGATRWDVIRLIGAAGLRLTAAGLAVGLVLTFLAGRAMEGLLFGIVTGSLSIACGLALLLGAVSVAASYLPARRAAGVDPTIALRSE